eukprot:TRINITY_DN4511_c0_g1_i1.p1 TRINITY_DN4511_c0_g1~~TRINITY_DN4511_c0_g1_i1.p1  ORF type:complete len:394 (+),score=82.70 TRINITY_DN4511_c0_g1_i1:71-1183(+)
MDDKYFEEMFNEGSEPFSDFANRLNPSLFSSLRRIETPPESNNSFDLESLKLEPPSLSVENKQNDTEELKEYLSVDKQSNNPVEKLNNVAASQKKRAAKNVRKGKVFDVDAPLTRAERNKRYARESRERRRQYVEELEQQVRSLRHEVEFYKARLKSYETIEKLKNTWGYEFYEVLNKAYTCMREANQPLSNKPVLREKLHKAFSQVLKEQENALKAIGRMIVDVSLPAHVRTIFWMCERKANVMGASDIAKTLGPIITLEQAQAFFEFKKSIDPEGAKNKELAEKAKVIYARLKESVRQIITCLKDILLIHKAIVDSYKTIKFSHYNPYFLEMRAWIDSQLMARPEVRENELNTLLESLTLDEDAQMNK